MISKIIYHKKNLRQKTDDNRFFDKLSIYRRTINNREMLFFIQSVCEFLKMNNDLHFCLSSSLHCLSSKNKKIFTNILFKMSQGKTLSALFLEANIFRHWSIKLIQFGEKTNNIANALLILKEFLTWEIENKKKLIHALAYPLITFFVAIGVIFTFADFIMPSILDTIGAINGECNYIFFSFFVFFLKSSIFAILIFLIFLGFLRFFNVKLFEKILIRIPVLKDFIKYRTIYINSRYIFSSLSQGIPINESFDIISTSKKTLMNEILLQLKADVSKGIKLHHSLQKYRCVPDVFIKIVKTGEDSGNLTNAFLLAQNLFFEKYQMLTEYISNYLPIGIIFFVAAMIISFVFTVFMPLYNVRF
jgi:general secretion pathway protein F/MSHA biogenesis protein MshG